MSILLELKDNKYVTSVWNYGELSDAELQTAFEYGVVRIGERERGGSHVALSIAKARLIEDSGGIELANDLSSGRKRVRATIWLPLSEKQQGVKS